MSQSSETTLYGEAWRDGQTEWNVTHGPVSRLRLMLDEATSDAADAAKWRAVEPLLREWIEANSALAREEWESGEFETACGRLRGAMDILYPFVQSLLAADVNCELTKEPAR